MSGCPFHQAGGAAQMPTIMEMLKFSTAALHDSAEGHAFQKSLVQGQLPREQYARYLGQLLLVHEALENALRDNAARVPAISKVVKEYQYQVPCLLEDLAFYGVDARTVSPTASTSALITEIELAAATNPVALLGYQYVLEGSNNGNKFIARAIGQAYRLPPGKGLKYLDPYGDQQRPYWQAFKDEMNACNFTPSEARAMCEAAAAMFAGIGRISSDMLEPAHV